MCKHLILAHNNIKIRDFFYDMFTRLGYKITTCLTHISALEALKNDPANYVILDPLLSDISANLTAQKIKEIDNTAKIIILPEQDTDTPENTCKKIAEIVSNNPNNQEARNRKKPLLSKANILIVEDEEESVEFMQKYLSRKGYNVDVVYSGKEAIPKINISQPDIILLDISIPGTNGMAVLKKIRERDNSMIVIMTTAVKNDWIMQEAVKLGISGYLVKPFTLPKLEETIITSITHKWHA